MSDKSTIYEITQLMHDKQILQNDLVEALNTVKDVFYKKYIYKFQQALDEHRELAKKQSSKEVDLLLALKPFIGENSQQTIDKIIDTMYTLNTAQSIDSEIRKYMPADETEIDSNSVRAASTTIVHDDGIYEIDENCMQNNSHSNNASINITEIIFMLLIIGIIK